MSTWEKSKSKAEVWRYFKKRSDEAMCNECGKILSCKGASTHSMHNHLKLHDMAVNKSEPPAKKARFSSITNFLEEKDSVSFKVARMAAVDGMSLNTLANSYDLHKMCPQLPKNGHTIKEHIIKVASIVTEKVKTEIQNLRKAGKLF